MPGRAIQALSFRFLATAAVVAGGLLFAPAAFAGVNDNVTGWAWSGSVGWISMNCTNQASCATADYGVTITEAPGFGDRGDLVGWAWSEAVGWICFGITCSGTTPEGGTPYAQYRANFNGKQDQFWGWAQVLSMGADGWIALNCDKDVGVDDCAASNHFVVLNNVTGAFTQGAANDHWGWGSNSNGVGLGWVDFSTVNTSWVLANLGLIQRPQGVYETNVYSATACASDAACTVLPYTRCDTGQGKCTLPGTHLAQFSIRFPTMSGALNQLLECVVRLPDGSKRVLNKVLTSAVRNGSPATSLTYDLVGTDAVQQNRIWYIDVCRITGSAFGAVCGAALCGGGQTCNAGTGTCFNGTVDTGVNCGDPVCGAGKICDELAGRCRTTIQESDKRKPIYTHGNAWTGLDASQDQYLAIKCNAGFPNNYFKNAAQCDFTGDASFALAMRRGIPVEGNCGDLIDNDGNGQIDCADRYCKGISYRCQTLPKTSCVYGYTPDFPTPPAGAGDGIIDCSYPSYEIGDLCCSRQPRLADPSRYHVVDGLECGYGDVDDGYFDCDCVAGQFGRNADCFAPGYQAGDLCCDATGHVLKP